MTRTIHKIRLPSLPSDPHVVFDTQTTKFLMVQYQNNIPHLWFEHDTEAEMRTFVVYCYGTGFDIDDDIYPPKHIGSLIDVAGFVWHWYIGTVK